MRWSYSLGKLFGIPISIHILFALTLLQPILTPGPHGRLFSLLGTVTVFLCVLLHELGHALVAKKYGLRVEGITLWPLGGFASIEGLEPNKPKQEFWIALAGPLVSLGIAAVFLLSVFSARHFGVNEEPQPPTWFVFAALMGYVNVVLAVFNLLPVYPMDGGRILRAMASWSFGPHKGMDIAANVSRILGGIIAITAFLLGEPFIGLIMLLMVLSASAEQRHRQTCSDCTHESDKPEGSNQ